MTSGRSQFNLGIDALGITRNDGPIPDGRFFSWAGQVVRVQQLDRNNRLILQGDLQLTPSNLLGSETFSIGGGQTLRGYRQGARSGDNGWRFSAENRFTFARSNEGQNLFQVAPFFDMGAVWNNPSNPAQIRSDHFLAGLGLGFLWISQPHLTARVDFTLPLMNTSDRATNLQDDGIYFSLNYQF
ncbi:ShlB/FhaC/HecB family hemolysin secretion/activation protein [Spirulina sp. CCNP1310]|uniref:ShlB/FhaC/HecB family hemolysin secretion/activation protein n=1 Tax=Spirulina sp. CCNP1310 TaxID=3110249 RepID=UPI002B1F49A5|nr:ShlB/FhaC/HecB family hemolysin secretion/activation protein [Spirulina sp. CCNP1310]MEA5420512.1 ShlB/FhaC/HecB family hemolysin secretion/activation protein [Spirulina sp. CCNP1310]